jgi:hypothetical protein
MTTILSKLLESENLDDIFVPMSTEEAEKKILNKVSQVFAEKKPHSTYYFVVPIILRFPRRHNGNAINDVLCVREHEATKSVTKAYWNDVFTQEKDWSEIGWKDLPELVKKEFIAKLASLA